MLLTSKTLNILQLKFLGFLSMSLYLLSEKYFIDSKLK